MDAVAHKRLIYKNEFTVFARKFFPGLPIDVARHFAGEEGRFDFLRIEGDGRTADGVAKAKSEAFGPFVLGKSRDFKRSKKQAFDSEVGIGVNPFGAAKFIVVRKKNLSARAGRLIGLNDFFGIGMVVSVILVGDGDKRSISGRESRVEVAADGGVFAGFDF